MSKSRRQFLQSSAALAVGIASGAASKLTAEPQAQAENAPPAAPDTGPHVQVPKMKFGNAEISRLVLGVNPIYGFAHYNNNFGMRHARLVHARTRSARCCTGPTASASTPSTTSTWTALPQDLARFQAEGGKMHLIIQVMAKDDAAALVKNLKPLALQRRGEEIDAAFQNGNHGRRARVVQARPRPGRPGRRRHPQARSHRAGGRRRAGTSISTPAASTTAPAPPTSGSSAQRRDHGNAPRHLPAERSRAHVQSHAPDHQNLLRLQDSGRRAHRRRRRRQAFHTAYASIKPHDGVYVGMFPRFKDEVKENAEIVHSILTAA